MNRDIIKELSKWLDNYRAYIENHVGCDVFVPYDNTENAAEKLYIKHIKPYQNQKAIECLKEVKVKEMSCDGKKVPEKYIACFNAFIDNKIKELEGKE